MIRPCAIIFSRTRQSAGSRNQMNSRAWCYFFARIVPLFAVGQTFVIDGGYTAR